MLGFQHAHYKLSREYEAKIAELTHANCVDQNKAAVKNQTPMEELRQGLSQKEDKVLYIRAPVGESQSTIL